MHSVSSPERAREYLYSAELKCPAVSMTRRRIERECVLVLADVFTSADIHVTYFIILSLATNSPS